MTALFVVGVIAYFWAGSYLSGLVIREEDDPLAAFFAIWWPVGLVVAAAVVLRRAGCRTTRRLRGRRERLALPRARRVSR